MKAKIDKLKKKFGVGQGEESHPLEKSQENTWLFLFIHI